VRACMHACMHESVRMCMLVCRASGVCICAHVYLCVLECGRVRVCVRAFIINPLRINTHNIAKSFGHTHYNTKSYFPETTAIFPFERQPLFSANSTKMPPGKRFCQTVIQSHFISRGVISGSADVTHKAPEGKWTANHLWDILLALGSSVNGQTRDGHMASALTCICKHAPVFPGWFIYVITVRPGLVRFMPACTLSSAVILSEKGHATAISLFCKGGSLWPQQTRNVVPKFDTNLYTCVTGVSKCSRAVCEQCVTDTFVQGGIIG